MPSLVLVVLPLKHGAPQLGKITASASTAFWQIQTPYDRKELSSGERSSLRIVSKTPHSDDPNVLTLHDGPSRISSMKAGNDLTSLVAPNSFAKKNGGSRLLRVRGDSHTPKPCFRVRRIRVTIVEHRMHPGRMAAPSRAVPNVGRCVLQCHPSALGYTSTRRADAIR